MTVLSITSEARAVLAKYCATKGIEGHRTRQEYEEMLGQYLRNSLPHSIKIEWPRTIRDEPRDTFLRKLTSEIRVQGESRFFDSVLGWGASRGQSSWTKRAQSWYKEKDKSLILIPSNHHGSAYMILDTPREVMNELTTIPIWLSNLEWGSFSANSSDNKLCEAMWASNLCQEIPAPFVANTNSTFQINTESKTMNNKSIQIPTAFNAAIEQNKEALQLAAKLSVGKTANAFLVDALTAKLPWYAKLFGQKQAIKDNPLTKVATAQLANLLAQHFAQGNAKVTYVADAMLQEAMVDLITNADIVNDLITKLGSFAGDLTGETK